MSNFYHRIEIFLETNTQYASTSDLLEDILESLELGIRKKKLDLIVSKLSKLTVYEMQAK